MRSEKGTAAILDELARFIREEGDRRLVERRSLTVRITDIDLAGEFEPRAAARSSSAPGSSATSTRPASSSSSSSGTARGGRHCRGPAHPARSDLPDAVAFACPTDRLRYEKSLLEDWLREELGRDGKVIGAGASAPLFGWPVWASLAAHGLAISTVSALVALHPTASGAARAGADRGRADRAAASAAARAADAATPREDRGAEGW